MLAIEYYVHIATTPVKYEWDSKNVTGTFCEIKNFGELDERSFSNPHMPLSHGLTLNSG